MMPMTSLKTLVLISAAGLAATASAANCGRGGMPGYGPGYGAAYGPAYGQPPVAPWGYGQPMRPMQPMAGPGYYPQPAQAAAPATRPASGNESATTSSDTARVSVQGMRFGNGKITVKTGTTVEWVMRDQMPHTVTSDSGAFDSGRLGAGGTFSHTFDKPGTYDYFCQLHPDMRGTVVVEG
jgi:plastocyanin